MSDGAPTLEAGFVIETGDSFGNLKSLDDLIGAVAANTFREAQKIEQATKGMVKLDGPTASMSAFGSVTTRAMREAEKAGEGLSKSLSRQISAFGLTADEVRRLNVETKALAAEQQGLTELAGRLRAQGAQVSAMHAAAADKAGQEAAALRDAAIAYQQFEAAARAGAAAMRSAAADEQAKQIREAAQAYQMFEAAAKAGAAAMREADAAADATRIREAAQAYQMFEARARQGAQAMRDAASAEEKAAAAADKLRSTIDPLWGAQKRYDDELRMWAVAAKAGTVSEDEHAAAVRQSKLAFDAAKDAVEGHSQAVGFIACNS
jgi:hypothetical protein